ncbi:MAG: hypothetical protein LUD17_01465 [Bacteroidales bacterium]|nr:hypothetical protein [Bacteroidales bacterium]
MRKIFTLALAATAIAACAQSPSLAQKVAVSNGQAQPTAEAQPNVKFASHLQRMSRADAEIIYEAPGAEIIYKEYAFGFYPGWWGMSVQNGTFLNRIAWDGDVVYFRDIVSTYEIETYVRGTRQGDQIKVQFPQAVGYYGNGYDEDGNQIWEVLYANKVVQITYELDGEETIGYVIPEDEDNYVIYNILADGTIELDLGVEVSSEPVDGYYVWPTAMIGFTFDNNVGDPESWAYYGTGIAKYGAFDEAPLSLPDGLTSQRYGITCLDANGESKARMIEGAIDGEKLYLGHLYDNFASAYIEGTIDGDKVTFKSGQYLGYMADTRSFIYFMAADADLIETEYYSYYNFSLADEITFDYDTEAQTLTCADGRAMLVNAEKDRVYYWSEFINPTIKHQSDEQMDAAPKNPTLSSYFAYEPDWGYGWVAWDIPAENVNGYVLDPTRMYYHLTINGEVMTLYNDEYPGMDVDELTDIPYLYYDAYYWIYVYGTYHQIYTFYQGEESVGIQSFFQGYDGNVYASDIVTYAPSTDKISDIENEAEVVSESYYDLQGRRVVNPAAGSLLIRVATYADGTTSATKIVK